MLRRIIGTRKDRVTGDWKKLHNEELNDLYTSPNIVLMIKSRRMNWLTNVPGMGDRRGVNRFLLGNMRNRGYLEDPDVDGRNILRWIYRK